LTRSNAEHMDQSFGKEYKLCSKKLIDALFKEGKSVKAFPFTLFFMAQENSANVPFQLVISAPKRINRHAHDRNRIKRVVREAIRKNKFILEDFLTKTNQQLALFLVYTSKEELTTDQLDKKSKKLFTQLIEKLEHDQ
jgi:ribonuclease P protein component